MVFDPKLLRNFRPKIRRNEFVIPIPYNLNINIKYDFHDCHH